MAGSRRDNRDETVGRAAAAADVSGAPTEVELLPAGTIRTRPNDGRADFVNDDPDGVVAASRALILDLPIDYEHQSEYARENGREAPAAGWMRELFVRAGAVWARVDWTEKAAAHLTAREYRFLSPVFAYDRATRQVKRVESAGLTNNPAFFMRALARAQGNDEEESEMDLKEIAKALGLAETAGEAEILAAAKAAAKVAGEAAAAAEAVRAIAKAAGLAEDASAEDVAEAVKTARAAATAKAGEVDPAKFIPRAEFDEVRGQLTRIETEGAEARATAAVDDAIKAGKVTPASREWALGYARKDPDGFAEFAKGAPAILADGRVVPSAEPGEAGSALTADERAVCRAMGISDEDYVRSRKSLNSAETEEAA